MGLFPEGAAEWVFNIAMGVDERVMQLAFGRSTTRALGRKAPWNC